MFSFCSLFFRLIENHSQQLPKLLKTLDNHPQQLSKLLKTLDNQYQFKLIAFLLSNENNRLQANPLKLLANLI